MLAVVRHRKEIVVCITADIRYFISAHGIGIHVYRVDRIRNQDHIVVTEKLGDVSCITFGPVRNKDRICIHFHAVSFIISCDGISCFCISLFRTVAFESSRLSHLVYALMKRFDGTFAQRTGNITDSQSDHRFVRMFFAVSSGTVCNL